MTIAVLTTNHRPATIKPYLSSVPYSEVVNPDDAAPAATPYDDYSPNPLGAYRCFRGHQRCAALAQGTPLLILEDDAKPNRDDWFSVCCAAVPLLGQYDVVGLATRYRPVDVGGRGSLSGVEYVTLQPVDRLTWFGEKVNAKWGIGSLAYLITPTAADRLAAAVWDGYPVDLLLFNRFDACALSVSPFDHDRSNGSLVEGAK